MSEITLEALKQAVELMKQEPPMTELRMGVAAYHQLIALLKPSDQPEDFTGIRLILDDTLGPNEWEFL